MVYDSMLGNNYCELKTSDLVAYDLKSRKGKAVTIEVNDRQMKSFRTE